MFYVYILYSPSSNKYYVGQTADMEIRLSFHNEIGKDSYTSKHRPWTLRKTIEFESRRLALAAEKYIKKRKSRKYIEELIKYESIVIALKEKIEKPL